MAKRRLTIALFALLAVVRAVVAAQAPVPVSEEPRHRVVFENELVRVIDAFVPAGDLTLFHTHARDNVPVAISGGRLRTETLGGEPREDEVRTGAAWFARGGYTHRIRNVGETAAHFLDAELLDAPVAGGPGVPELAAHTLEFENERVRIYRVVVRPGPGDEPARHVHVLPWLGVEVSRRQGDRAPAGPAEAARASTIPFAWHEAGPADPYRGESSGAEWVEIEWKSASPN